MQFFVKRDRFSVRYDRVLNSNAINRRIIFIYIFFHRLLVNKF